MSFIPINTALSSVRLINQQIDLVSNNIANASTPGYTRKTLPQYSSAINGEGRGVLAGMVQRQMDVVLQRDLFTQTARTNSLEVKSRYQAIIQNFHGDPTANVSITAEIGQLKDSFAELANDPSSVPLLDTTFAQAAHVANKFNDFSALLSEMRNDAQNEMQLSVDNINNMLEEIAALNLAISSERGQNRSTVTLEDERDKALTALSKEIDIDYFENPSGVMEVMTRRGTALADTLARPILFAPEPIGPQSSYPASVAGVFVDSETTGTDLTTQVGLGGRLGSLIELRDQDLPRYQAQLDELAHKMATRFEQAGMRLFTDEAGVVPSNTPANYAGFSAEMVVNPAIANDHSLLRTGTSGAVVQDGSPEFLRRVVENVFGSTAALEALGDVDISGVGDLFTTLGIDRRAQVIGTKNIESLNDLIANSTYLEAGVDDTFNITIGAGLPQDIVINPGDTASDLVNTINGFFPGLASIGPSGQLVFTSNDTITIGTTNLSPNGLEELGIELGTTVPVNPSFSIVVGIDDPINIPITPTDTGTDLVNTINSLVPKVTASLDVNGFLQIVPNDGGDISFIEGLGNPVTALGLNVSNVAHTAFNSTNVGPNSDISTGLTSATTLADYAKLMVSKQSSEANNNAQQYEFETTYFQTIEKQVNDLSGVNLDEEMSTLIQLQTAYSASTKVIETYNTMLEDLFLIFR
jgi:flagellar hook-associated protein 1 FlgK